MHAVVDRNLTHCPTYSFVLNSHVQCTPYTTWINGARCRRGMHSESDSEWQIGQSIVGQSSGEMSSNDRRYSNIRSTNECLMQNALFFLRFSVCTTYSNWLLYSIRNGVRFQKCCKPFPNSVAFHFTLGFSQVYERTSNCIRRSIASLRDSICLRND